MDWGPKIFEALTPWAAGQLIAHVLAWREKPEPKPPAPFRFPDSTLEAALKVLRVVLDDYWPRAMRRDGRQSGDLRALVHYPLSMSMASESTPLDLPPEVRCEWAVSLSTMTVQFRFSLPTERRTTSTGRVVWPTVETIWGTITAEYYARGSERERRYIALSVLQGLAVRAERDINRGREKAA